MRWTSCTQPTGSGWCSVTSVTLWIVAGLLVAVHVALCIRDAKVQARNRRAYHDALRRYIKRWREGWRKGVWDGTGDIGAGGADARCIDGRKRRPRSDGRTAADEAATGSE